MILVDGHVCMVSLDGMVFLVGSFELVFRLLFFFLVVCDVGCLFLSWTEVLVLMMRVPVATSALFRNRMSRLLFASGLVYRWFLVVCLRFVCIIWFVVFFGYCVLDWFYVFYVCLKFCILLCVDGFFAVLDWWLVDVDMLRSRCSRRSRRSWVVLRMVVVLLLVVRRLWYGFLWSPMSLCFVVMVFICCEIILRFIFLYFVLNSLLVLVLVVGF